MKRAFPLLLLALTAGCQPGLKEDFTLNVSGGHPEAKEIPSVKGKRTINISAKTDGGKIDVYFYLKRHQAEVEPNLLAAGSKLLASKRGVTETKLSATVPGNEEAIIRVESSDGKKVEVKLKIFT